MSLGIAFKGPEGIVLAADSRVTLNAQVLIPNGPPMMLPATFDNATKLLRAKDQEYVGAITYGAGAIGLQAPRTAHSYIPEFEASLPSKTRLSVEDFAKALSNFFMARWADAGMPNPVPAGQDMIFLVGGYDLDAVYGRIFEIYIPSRPEPHETMPLEQFGATWGGQHQIVSRIINGTDPMNTDLTRNFLNVRYAVQAGQMDPLEVELRTKLALKIPWQFLPLQDCVDLSIFLIRATITLQKWTIDVRGVGGAVDVATITRTKGFSYLQQKVITGEVIK